MPVHSSLPTLTPERIAELDTQRMRESIRVFDAQVLDAWQVASKTVIPDYSADTTHIACFAMGGSALGMDVVRNACAAQLSVPVSIINDYHIPASVNERTFVILSSYSGATEETLSAAESILKRTKRVVVITTGGKLADFARTHKLPAYIFQPAFNPSNQPRMALGYSIASILALLSKAKLLNLPEHTIDELINGIRRSNAACETLSDNNPATQIAQFCANRIPVLFSSEHLSGILHAVTNQINENGKAFAIRFELPEANHHLTEAIISPDILPELTACIFFSSSLYHTRTQQRYKLTSQLFTEKKFATHTYPVQSESVWSQVGEVMALGAWISFYLAMYGDLDPSPIPQVDWLKTQLSKH